MTWKQTLSGRAVDLVAPDPATIDLITDIAIPLSRIARFTGHTRFAPPEAIELYSVAQHSVIGAEVLLEETGRADVALAFLLHDAHEAYLGDVATPIVAALDTVIMARAPAAPLPDHLYPSAAFGALKERLDRAIRARLGLAWPLLDDVATLVGTMDVRMLREERDALLGPAPEPWVSGVEEAAPIPAGWRAELDPWTPMQALAAFGRRLRLWCPSAFGDAV